MTEEKRKEFFTKFTKVVGDTTKHYEFKDVDPLEVFDWIDTYAQERVEEAIETSFNTGFICGQIGKQGGALESLKSKYLKS